MSMKNYSKDNTSAIKLITIANFICFVIYGFIDSLKGSTLSSLLADQNFSYTIGGSLILWSNLGAVLSVVISTFVFKVNGRKSTLVIGLLIMAFSTVAFSNLAGIDRKSVV